MHLIRRYPAGTTATLLRTVSSCYLTPAVKCWQEKCCIRSAQLEEINLFFSTGVALCQFEAFLLGEQRMAPVSAVQCLAPWGMNSLVPNQDDVCWSRAMGRPRGPTVQLLTTQNYFLVHSGLSFTGLRRVALAADVTCSGSNQELPPAPRANASPVFCITDAVASMLLAWGSQQNPRPLLRSLPRASKQLPFP